MAMIDGSIYGHGTSTMYSNASLIMLVVVAEEMVVGRTDDDNL